MDEAILRKLGIKVGHYTDTKSLIGTTAFISEKGANVGIDVRGSWPGTLNIPAHDPRSMEQLVHGVVLTGWGSMYGLESAFGVMQYLEERAIGNPATVGIIPSITGAVIYDLAVGNANVRPGKQEGYSCAKMASYDNLAQGNVGVGTGATTGNWFKR